LFYEKYCCYNNNSTSLKKIREKGFIMKLFFISLMVTFGCINLFSMDTPQSTITPQESPSDRRALDRAPERQLKKTTSYRDIILRLQKRKAKTGKGETL
jgi:hypothetical protein